MWYAGGMAGEQTSFVYFGSDEGAAAADAAKKYGVLTAGNEGWGNEVIDGMASTVDEATQALRRTCDALQMISMFGGRKVIWLRGVNFMADTASGARSEAVQGGMDELVDTLRNMPPDTFLVMNAAEVDKRRAFFKKLSAVAEMHEYVGIDITREGWESEVASLTLKLAQPLGLKFDNAAMELFVQRVNESTRQIAGELTKLDIYLGPENRTVTEQDVETIVPLSRHGVIFEISRAIERRNARLAIRLLNEQLAGGEQAISIMRAAIVPTVRRQYSTRLLMDEYGLSTRQGYRGFESALNALPQEARKLIPRKKDGSLSCYGVYTAATALGELTLKQARQHLFACAQADRRLVSTQADVRDVLHTLVMTLTA